MQDMPGHSSLKTTKRRLHETADHIDKMDKKIEKLAEEAASASGADQGRIIAIKGA
jgi:hypothetical protein